MNGEIRVHSAPGKGSCFKVSLPLKTQHKQIEHGRLAGRIVAIGGTLSDVEGTLSRYLDAETASTKPIKSLKAFENQILSKSADLPDVVILQDPDESWEPLRNALRKSGLPIIVVSTNADDSGDDLNIWAADLTTSGLVEAVTQVCENVITSEAEPVPPAGEPPSGQLILVAEDNVINQQILGQQLSILGFEVDFADDGK